MARCLPREREIRGLLLATDTSPLPVNHCSHSTAFDALNRKARGTRGDRKTALQAEEQHDVNSVGHIVTDGRKKARGSCSAVRVNDAPRSMKDNLFTQLSLARRLFQDF